MQDLSTQKDEMKLAKEAENPENNKIIGVKRALNFEESLNEPLQKKICLDRYSTPAKKS